MPTLRITGKHLTYFDTDLVSQMKLSEPCAGGGVGRGGSPLIPGFESQN